MDSNPEVSCHIGKNVPWAKLPPKVKEIFGNAVKGYEKAVISYSVRNQLRYSENLVKTIRKDEGKYYEDIVNYSKDHLMLYPYHLSDRIVKGLRITPFLYYISVLEKIMEQEKSYDSLPNFTAADCLRLLGIGRNQYIELMNQHRSSRKLFRRKPPRELLPIKPVDVAIEPWFIIQVGYITEEDIMTIKENEKKIIDFLIDNRGQKAGIFDSDGVKVLYRKGLIYFDVPIQSDDYIVVPPLEGFVMNRVLGDYFETLLYKIFVSIDEHTTVEDLATVLDIDQQLIKNAVSLYCRLGFAYKKNLDIDYNQLDASWRNHQPQFHKSKSYIGPEDLMNDLRAAMNEPESRNRTPEPNISHSELSPSLLSTSHSMTNFSSVAKRIAFLYDSTLTAYLMMGNLSPGLKNHAVTMFEVGKMADESLDSFITELENISWTEGEGEAQRYFEHAITLRKTIMFLRNNPRLGSMALDLLRCESLLNLDSQTCSRLLNKNYGLLVSMAPLSYEVMPVCCENLPQFGPAIPEVNSIWFKLFLYSSIQSGPTSLLLPRGTTIYELPPELEDCDKYLVTSWDHDPGVIPGSNVLFTLTETLSHSSVLVQAYGTQGESSTVIVPFPFPKKNKTEGGGDENVFDSRWIKHPSILKLSRLIDLERNVGFITMVNVRGSNLQAINHRAKENPFAKKLPMLNEREEEDEKDESEEEIVFVSPHKAGSETGSEPHNGFKDDSCAKLYQDELDELEFGDEEKKSVAVFDCRQQKIESLRLDLGCEMGKVEMEGEDLWFDDWTFLDCQFGIPLFDSSVNEATCRRIVENDLCDEQSLEKLMKSNKELGEKLKAFISSHQEENLWKLEIPMPSRSFYCHNGSLSEFKT